MSAPTETAIHLRTQMDGCQPDRSPAHPNPIGAILMLPDTRDQKPVDALVEYVSTATPDERIPRLVFAAGEAARIVALNGGHRGDRTSILFRLATAAQMAGIGLRDAEKILRDAFTGGAPW